MTAKSTKGTQVHLLRGDATPTILTPTAITEAKPAVVTVASTTGMTDGDIVVMKDTGYDELNEKAFIAGVVNATTFELMSMDLSGSTGALAATPKAHTFTSADAVLLCLSALTMNVNEPGTVSTGTFCDPTTSLPSAVVEAGTLTMTGYVDVTSPDYQELLIAEEDGLERVIRVTLPSNGYLIAPITISTINWDLPLDGAVGYNCTAVLGSKLKHVY